MERTILAELIREHSTRIQGNDGVIYLARTYGREREDGTWEGWLEFYPVDGSRPPLRTGQETSQHNRSSLDYWSSGLEPVYLEGAFARAR